MPELPEVETVKKALLKKVQNKKILKMKQEKQYQMLTYCKKDGTIIKRM